MLGAVLVFRRWRANISSTRVQDQVSLTYLEVRVDRVPNRHEIGNLLIFSSLASSQCVSVRELTRSLDSLT